MCLGDLRFSPHVVAVPRLITVGTSWSRIIEKRRERVGVIFGIPNANNIYVWPGVEAPSGTAGIPLRSADGRPVHYVYLDHGTLPSEQWLGIATTAATTLPAIELVTTPAIIEEIIRMGLR